MRKPNFIITILLSIAISILFFNNLSVESNLSIEPMATIPGGVRPSGGSQNSAEVENLGLFAVDEHNKKENGAVEFVRVVKAAEQVVAGTLHRLTVEAIDGGRKKLYEAKVWVKPWMNFKELQEFKHAGAADDDSPSFTVSDLGLKQDGHGSGLQSVPTHDPVVQDAANHALKTIQQRSNSLMPYELKEIVLANAEVVEDLAKLEMLLKVKRGDKEEKFKEVHHKSEGTFHLNSMEPDLS
ncbi:Cysteine proteinase inhibitor 6 [Hibiscus syriacus]|uniref:Cysteine proteinase inhibitor n=1 Tax=Hibiscus syriacus TaxID=106335 RepID=A0A6A2X105_HIBSY|nr:cysteine proteinase inhibitor 12-like [Hibiscus syriacus]KAE8655546.1 Cysteine proteinase inhibitor 6 [Hibiscus syriacus]